MKVGFEAVAMVVTILVLRVTTYIVQGVDLGMEELTVTLVRDLPGTAVLILFVWLTNKQFSKAVDMISDHLKEINAILEQCVKKANLDERMKDVELKMFKVDDLMDRAKERARNQEDQ